MTGRPTLGRSALLTAVGLATIGLVRVGAGILAERRFGAVGLAVFATGIGIATNATIVGAAGLASGLTKLLAEREGAAAAAFRSFATRWALILTAAGAIGGAAYARFDPVIDNAPRGTFAAVAALTVFFGAYQTGKAIAYGDGRLPSYVRREIAGAALFAAGAALALLADNPAVILFALAAAYLPVAAFVIDAKPWERPSVEVPVREFGQYGLVGSVGSLAGIGFTRLTPIAAGFAAGVTGSAIVGAALVLLEPLYLAPRSIGLALLPRLAQQRAEGEIATAGDEIRMATGVTAAVSLPVCASLALFPDAITAVFFDQVRGGLTLTVFAAAFFVSVVGAPSITGLSAISPKSASISMWSSLVGFVVAIVMWLILAAELGTLAIAWGYLVGSVIQVAAPAVVASRRFSVRWRSFLPRLAVIIALVSLAIGMPSIVRYGVIAASMGLLLPEYRTGVAMVRH